MPNTTLDANMRRGDIYCGRLVAMATNYEGMALVSNTDLANTISIDFPSMPDSVALARSADYQVAYTPQNPDGIHVYKGTKPLEIPFSFRLHAFDKQYCKRGALTLINLAARLHAFTLPIDVTGNARNLSVSAGIPVGKTAAEIQSNANTEKVFLSSSTASPNPPVTCWLFLMATDATNTAPGISAIGYVKDVNVKLNGPWLRGPNKSFNLPSSGDFEFTFVHHPGHGNAMQFTDDTGVDVSGNVQVAMADYVKDSFYNTRHLVAGANYQSFAGGDATVDESVV